jgi:hypothetical protein
VLTDGFGFAVYLYEGRDATAVEVGHDDEAVLGDPDCHSLQVEFLGGFVVLEKAGELFDKNH